MSNPSPARLSKGFATAAHHNPPSTTGASPSALAKPAGEGQLVVHDRLASLDSLEDAWRTLTSGNASPFRTYAWNAAWYAGYATGGLRPLVFELRRRGATAAILPCYRDGRVLRLAGDRIGGEQDAIARNSRDVAALLHHIRSWLGREGRGCRFRFERVPDRGALHAVLGDPARLPPDSLRFAQHQAPLPRIELRGGLEDLLAALPQEERNEQRRVLNRFDREHPEAAVSILRGAEAGIDDLWIAAAFHVEHTAKQGESPFHDHRLIDLFARVAKDPDAGFQLASLRSRGRLLAVDFGFVRGGRYHRYLGAGDRACESLAPGRCLLLKRIDRWVAEDGVRALDLPERDAEGAFAANASRRIWSFRFMPDNVRNRLRRAGLESDKRFRRIARRALGMEEGLAR